jgi:predicted LPLAT superfamily acyltransferase
MTAQPAWLAQRERGSRTLIWLIVKVTLLLGRSVGRVLLYPICTYFLLFSGRARRASRDYLCRALARPPGWRDLFAHYHCFAQTILDRVVLLSGQYDQFDYDLDGIDVLRGALAQGRGCLLYGAHFGSFDVLRALGSAESPVAVKVLMHEDNAEKLNSVLAMLNRELPKQIIPLGRAETMFRVAEALSRNEIVGLLADRIVAGDKMLRCNFLDADAPFPEGPFILASVLKAPVVLFSAIYCGGRRYRISFEPFDDSQSAALSATATPCSRRSSATRTGSLAAASPLLTTGSISMIFGPMSSNPELTWSCRLSLVVALIAMTPAAGAFDMADLMALMGRVKRAALRSRRPNRSRR